MYIHTRAAGAQEQEQEQEGCGHCGGQDKKSALGASMSTHTYNMQHSFSTRPPTETPPVEDHTSIYITKPIYMGYMCALFPHLHKRQASERAVIDSHYLHKRVHHFGYIQIYNQYTRIYMIYELGYESHKTNLFLAWNLFYPPTNFSLFLC